MKDKLSIVKEKRFRLFSLSLLVAIVAWFIINLSKNYTKKVTVVVQLTNVEKGYELSKQLDTLEVTLEASGLILLNKSLKDLNYTVDVTKFGEGWNWKNDEYNFRRIFSEGVEIKSVAPSVLSYQKTKLYSKKVLIDNKISVLPKLGYGIFKEELSPRKIEVFGAKELLKNIQSIKTEVKSFTEVSDTLMGKIALEEIKGIRLEKDSISYSYYVEQYTQGEFVVPIKVKNKPADKDITIFPKEVRLQFQSPLSIYNSLTVSQFQVSVNAANYQDSELLQISIEGKPDKVKEVRLLKKAVNFIVIDK